MIIPDKTLIVLSIVYLLLLKVIIGFYNEDLTGAMDTGYMIIFMLLDALIMFIIMFILQKIGDS